MPLGAGATKVVLTAKHKAVVRELAEKKYASVFAGGVHFTSKCIELRGYNYRSYGIVRKIIDALNRV
jgi:hypothetical protein